MVPVAALTTEEEVFHSHATIPLSVRLGSSTATSVAVLPAISPAEKESPPPPEAQKIFIVGAEVVVNWPDVIVVSVESSMVVEEVLRETAGTANFSTTIA